MLQAVLERVAGRESYLCGLEQAGLQTICSNAAFACSKIHTVAPEYLEPSSADPGKVFAIRGMEKACREAFSSGLLWSEIPLPWSQSPGRMEREHFMGFHGVRESVRKNEPALAEAL